jgi:hypothetical protein
MLACCSVGPLPLSAIQHIASNSSRPGIGHERGSRRIEPAAVLQFQGSVEAEEIGGADRV